MKIDQILNRQTVQESKPSVGPGGGAGGDDAFALLLQKEMTNQVQQACPDIAASGPTSLAGLMSVQDAVPGSAQSPELSRAVSALDGVLANLDSLSGALIQGNKSPREIDSMIEGINAQAAGLDETMSVLPAGHQLRDVAEELKVTAFMESLKWKRGDYL